jgi:tRNA(Ile)-lysidine synthase
MPIYTHGDVAQKKHLAKAEHPFYRFADNLCRGEWVDRTINNRYVLRRVKTYIRDNQLLQDGARVLVCVSGGADSVALLDVLKRGGYECVVAHCNFHLRGEESLRDELFVRELAGDLPLHVKAFDTKKHARATRQSVELAARELRYGWFAQLAEQEGCQAIAVAHHQNDQAETLIMNLKRGCGIRGLCGMRAKSGNPYASNGIPVIRPLLCTTRDYIQHYLQDIRKMAWVEDSTNTDTAFKRNAVRDEIKHYTKAEIEHMAATAENMQGYVDWLDKQETRAAGIAKLYEEMKE